MDDHQNLRDPELEAIMDDLVEHRNLSEEAGDIAALERAISALKGHSYFASKTSRATTTIKDMKNG